MLSSQKESWPCFRFPSKDIGGTNGRTSSVFARKPEKMIAGEQEKNEFPAADAPQRRIVLGESSSARGLLGSCEEEKPKSWEIKEFLGHEEQQSREKESLAQRIEELEKELYDYQYHMGLLLIEKRMRTSEFEQLRQGLTEAKENLKRECKAFSNILTEKQKLEQSIMLALDNERKHVADLEKTICKMQEQEQYLTQQKASWYCWEPGFQEPEKELTESLDVFDGRRMNATDNNDALCDEKKENLIEALNSFDMVATKEKETGSKLENKEGDLVATEVKLAVGESVRHPVGSERKMFQPEKLVFEQELENERESLNEELNNKHGELGKQIAVGEECRRNLLDDLLVQKKEIEADQVKLHKDKETLNELYSSLQNINIEILKKRDLLLSFAGRCKTCKNCSTIFRELELAKLEAPMVAELAGDVLLSNISREHLEKRMIDQNADDCILSLQQCSVLFSSEGKDGSQSIGSRCKETTERSVEAVHSVQQFSGMANDSREVHCEPNVSSIHEESNSSDEFLRKKRPRDVLSERIHSMKEAAKEAEATLKDDAKEMEQHRNWNSVDSKNVCVERKLNSLSSSDLMSPKQEEPSLHADETAISMIDSNDEQHKRQKTSDVGMSSTKEKHYNFRPSTILKASRCHVEKSEEGLADEDTDGDYNYEPDHGESD
ncbi:hypothetical protein HPP92_024702 [Vanilla planifolia]|uniref:Uncharacterized protein n=1 Tax=Vanilla planifolia TaxID=51239 RepID=A0A835UBS4_VANPL|nr:hypothetical protein HPP92_024702 [Vanilla planifolia]